MNSISKVYLINKLDNMVDECNNTPRRIKMKTIDVKSSNIF